MKSFGGLDLRVRVSLMRRGYKKKIGDKGRENHFRKKKNKEREVRV